MSKRRQSSADGESSLSAMVDVVFLLLMYFIVSFKPSIMEAQMHINLPSPQAGPPGQPPISLFEVWVMPNSRYKLMGKADIELDDLRDRLVELATFDPESTVIIKVDGDAYEGSLVNLLDLCANAKLKNLNVVSLNKGTKG